jgi:hypothetical protein
VVDGTAGWVVYFDAWIRLLCAVACELSDRIFIVAAGICVVRIEASRIVCEFAAVARYSYA